MSGRSAIRNWISAMRPAHVLFWPAVGLGLAYLLGTGTITAGSKPAQSRTDVPSLPNGAIAHFSASKGETLHPIGFVSEGREVVLRSTSAILVGNIKSGQSRILARCAALHAAVSADSKVLVTNGSEATTSTGARVYDGRVFEYWDVASGTKEKSATHPLSDVHKVFALSPNGRCLAWENPRGLFIDRDGEKAVKTILTSTTVLDLAFSANSKLLAVSCRRPEGYEIRILKVDSLEEVAVLRADKGSGMGGISFSPDAETLAVGAWPAIDLWDLSQKRIKRKLLQRGGSVRFMPDGHTLRVSTVEYDGKVGVPIGRLIETATGQAICEFRGHKKGIQDMIASSQAHVMATGDGAEVLIWDLEAPPGLHVRKKAHDLSKEQLQELWKELDNNSPAQGYKAMLQLAQGGQTVVRALQKWLSPAPERDSKQINQWISDLDAPAFPKREHAMKALQDLGRLAEMDLRNALPKNPPPEAKRRLESLVARFRSDEPLPGDLQQLRAVQVLERLRARESTELLRKLATGGSWSAQTQAAKSSIERLAARGP